jgi:hypothetical protein
MDTTDDAGKGAAPKRGTAPAAGEAAAGSSPVGDRPLGPDAVAILSTEHWSLIASRSMLWNEALNRTAIFLSVLSAAIVALALLVIATHFGTRPTKVSLELLPVVRFAPLLERYVRRSSVVDERGLSVMYVRARSQRGPWRQVLNSTPTIIATVNAALAAVKGHAQVARPPPSCAPGSEPPEAPADEPLRPGPALRLRGIARSDPGDEGISHRPRHIRSPLGQLRVSVATVLSRAASQHYGWW